MLRLLRSNTLPRRKKPETQYKHFDLYEHNFHRDLVYVGEIISDQLLKKNAARGHKKMRMAFAPVLMHIKKSGTRAIDIAEQADMSKQAVGKTAQKLEELGYIYQEVSKKDARSKYLKYTDKGQKLVNDTRESLDEVIQEMEGLIGKTNARNLIKLIKLAANKWKELEHPEADQTELD